MDAKAEAKPRKRKRQDPAERQSLAIIRDYAAVVHTDMLQKNRYVLGGNKTGALSAREQKVVLATVARIKPEDKELLPQDFDIQEFCKLCGIACHGGRPVKDVVEVINKLASRTMWLYEPATESGGEKISVVHWLRKAEILPGKKYTIRLTLDSDMVPFLIGLSKNYTKLYLHDVLRMSSRYSILLYQILSSYAFMERPISFDVADLQERLDCVKPSYQKNFNLFRTRVLEPAVSEINKYSSIKVTMNAQKKGHSVVKVIFTVHKLRDSDKLKDQQEYNARYDRVEEEISQAEEGPFTLTKEDIVKMNAFDASANMPDGDMAYHDDPNEEIPPLFDM